MNKITKTLLLLASASFANGLTGTGNSQNSFFMEASVGAQYLQFMDKQDVQAAHYDEKSDKNLEGTEHYRRFFDGIGPEFSFKFGKMVNDQVAVFADLGFSSISGKYRNVEKFCGKVTDKIKYDTDASRFFVGAGAKYYFVPDPMSLLYGLYAGASVGIMADYAGDAEKSDDMVTDFNETGLSGAVEVGKLWNVQDKWNVGVYGRAAYDLPVEIVSIGDPDAEESQAFYTLSVGVVFTRK